jgi:hypothetical protein
MSEVVLFSLLTILQQEHLVQPHTPGTRLSTRIPTTPQVWPDPFVLENAYPPSAERQKSPSPRKHIISLGVCHASSYHVSVHSGDGGVGETGLPATYQHPRTLFEPSTIQYLVTDREHRPTAADPVP